MKRDGVTPWPPEFAQRYAAQGYWRGRPLGHWMWTWADRHGDRVAVVDGDRAVRYRELAEHADALADHLHDLGLRDGDNILVQLPNTWEFLALFLACQRIGVAPVLALMAHREHELRYLAELAQVKAIVVPEEWQRFDHRRMAVDLAAALGDPCQVIVLGEADESTVDLRSLLEKWQDPQRLRARLDDHEPDSGEVALFLLSGGTTGTPKIIARTHDDYELNARQSGAVCGFDEDTVYLVTLPMGHNFPLGSPGILATLIHGGRVVMLRSPKPEVAFPLIERERATVTSLVPAIAQRWVEAASSGLPGSGHDLSSLRLVQVGGSVLDPAFAARIGPALGATLQQVYGMAEGLLNYTRPDDPAEVVNHTQGRPICPADEVKLVDEAGAEVPPGGTGELLTRGPYTPRGYFRAPEHNARAFTPDGWYRSGDLVRWDATGNLVVEGRVKDLINRGGEKISAPEVEAVVDLLPQVRRATAIALPDPAYGELVCVCVVLHNGQTLTLERVREVFAEQGVAKFKHPQQLEIVADFPLTGVGKVDKKALRATILARGEASNHKAA